MKKHRATPSCTLITVFPGTFFSMRLGQLVIWAALLMVPFLTSAQSWDTVRIVDFSSYPSGGDINNIQGFTAQGFSLFYYGASGEEDDRCAFAQNFNAGDRIAMRVPLETGKEYRISINAKTSVPIPTRTMDFIYAPGNNIQQVTTVSSGVALPHGIDANEPGSNVSSNIFSVPANGNYWVAIRHSSSTSGVETWARLDNFMVEALEEAPSFSLTDNDGNPITGGIDAEPGTSFMLCLSPDSAPAENMALELSVDGDGSPHFSDFTTMPLTFPAGSTDSICFELSPASDTTTGTYTFKFEHGNDIVMDFQVVVEPCSVAGPDQTICAGESVQLGTGNLTEPTGVDYCYVWEPSTGLDNPGSSMPNASPLETTTYTVYVTSSEGDVICVDEVTVFVNQIEIQNGTIPEICAGEMVTISVNPIGQGPFSYTWETGENTASIDVSPEFGKSYLVAITDESTACTLVKEVKVNVYLPPNVEITSVYPSICVPTQPPGLQPGQGTGTRAPSNSNSEECVNAKTTMYVSPSYPSYDIQWSTGATDFSIEADEPREYSVTVTNSIGCSDIESYELGSCADVTLTPSLNSSGEGILDAGAGFTSYEWHDGSTGQTILVDGPGLYAVTVSNESGCSGQAEEFIDTYSYNPDEVYLVYATYVQQPSEAAKVHIYICTTGSEDEVTKSLILQEVRQEFNNGLTPIV